MASSLTNKMYIGSGIAGFGSLYSDTWKEAQERLNNQSMDALRRQMQTKWYSAVDWAIDLKPRETSKPLNQTFREELQAEVDKWLS
jgi:hypothetical protein